MAEVDALAPTKTIVAVAVSVGMMPTATTIRSMQDIAATARPYLRGLITGLTGQGFTLGTHYVIDYREVPQANLDDVNNFRPTAGLPARYYIFAMSTTVAWNAQRHTPSDRPIVAIVSDPKGVGVNAANVCGISGQRSQFGAIGYENFITTVAAPALTRVFVLHKEGYPPALDALRDILKNPSIEPTLLSVAKPDAIQNAITGLPQGPGGGLFILPADWFFAQPSNNLGSRARFAGLLAGN